MPQIKVFFLDRDGVINKEVNYLYKKENFIFIDGLFKALNQVSNLGFKLIIITNQSGISRGLYSKEEFETLTSWMIREFKKNDIDILDVFYCPHGPEDNCNCRKPKPGLFIQATNKYDINISESWMIGDSERDIIAAQLAGINNTVIVRSGHKIDESSTQARFILDSIKDLHQLEDYLE